MKYDEEYIHCNLKADDCYTGQWCSCSCQKCFTKVDKTAPEDVRSWNKDKAKQKLRQSELTYLFARGWTTLCGMNPYMVRPNETWQKDNGVILLTHDEALAEQKEKDK